MKFIVFPIMKKSIFILLTILSLHQATAQEHPEKKISSQIKEVTVFLDNAQIHRVKNVAVPKGESTFRFTGLSPFINPKSIQVSASGPLMILSVKHEQNYKDKSLRPPALVALENKYKALKDRIAEAETRLDLTNDQIDLLQRNKDIGGKNQVLTAQVLKSMADYYAAKMSELKFKQLKQQKTLKKLHKDEKLLIKQIRKIADTKIYPSGEIVVKVSSDKAFTSKFKLTYNVSQANWFPSYDIRLDDIDKPLRLTYKANVKQATQIDWKKIQLTFSSSNPTQSNEIPHLIPYRLGYNTAPPVYDKNITKVSGTVIDAGNGEHLPGVNVVVKGTSIATATDFDGKYQIVLPDKSSNTLVFSFIGYKTVEVPVHSPVINVAMEESKEMLESVVVNALGVDINRSGDDDEDNGYSFNNTKKMSVKGSHVEIIRKKKAEMNKPIPLDRIEKQTSVNFKIKRSYTVPSNNQVKVIPIINYDIPANYEYITVPKIDNNAFLTAYIKDWEQYNLLSGEANVFIDGTSVGKTLLDTGFAKDTLQVSLGVDKGIHIERKLDKKFTGRKFLGSKRTDTRKWRIVIKNNKNQAVNIEVHDQVPVSDRSDVDVEVKELSGGKLNPETGEVVWHLHLAPGKKKELILHYAVKLPKYDDMVIE